MTEIPERFIEQACAAKVEILIEEMLEGSHCKLLWAEIERMLLSKKTEDVDGVRDMTISDIIIVVAEHEAERMADAGDLDEDAQELSISYADGMGGARYDAEKDRRSEERDR